MYSQNIQKYNYLETKNLYKTIHNCCQEYPLEELFDRLGKKTFISNKMFPNPVYELVQGYKDFKKRKLLFAAKNSPIIYFMPNAHKPLWKFIIFVSMFGQVASSWDGITKEFFINRLKSIIGIEQLRGLIFEVRIQHLFCIEGGCKLEAVPEALDKNNESEEGSSPPDLVISSKEQKFQIECTTFRESIGHPIIQDAAKEFVNKLYSDPLYKELCPPDQYCTIEFTFDKKLVSNEKNNCYNPQTLLTQFKKDVDTPNVRIKKSNNPFQTKKISDEEAHQKLSLELQEMNGKTHKITLFSLSPTNYYEEIKTKVEEKLKSKFNNGYDYPLILCLELYNLPQAILPFLYMCEQYAEKPLLCATFGRVPLNLQDDWRLDVIKDEPDISFYTKSMGSYISLLPSLLQNRKIF